MGELLIVDNIVARCVLRLGRNFTSDLPIPKQTTFLPSRDHFNVLRAAIKNFEAPYTALS